VLLNYFTAPVLALTFLMGYLMFFLFFYRTVHWKNLDWADRGIFSFLIGLSTMIFLLFLEAQVYSLLSAFRMEQAFQGIFYIIPVCFLTFLIIRRMDLKAPLSSRKASKEISETLRKRRFHWPYLLMAFSLTAYLWLGWNNPFFAGSTKSSWGLFIFWFNIIAFFVFFILSWLIAQLSCLPSGASSERFSRLTADVFKFCFSPVHSKEPLKKDQETHKPIEPKKEQRPRARQTLSHKLSFLRSDFLHKILIAVLLAAIIMMADGAFHLFTPSVQVIETYYADESQITVSNGPGTSISYTVPVVKTYWISQPVFPIRYLNLSIPNPSNFSVYDGSKYPSERAINVEADPTLGYAFQTNSSGAITAIDVTPLNGSLAKPQSFIKLSYNDALSNQFITTTQPAQVNLENGSISVTMSIIINNTDSRSLYSNQFALFSVQNYGNMTSFAFFANGTLQPSHFNMVWDYWLWTAIFASPHSFVNLSVSTVFEEALH
jgi:hypothetical protein